MSATSEAHAAGQRAWRKANPEKSRAAVARWAAKNKDKKAADNAKWKSENKERRLAVKKAHYERARKRLNELKSKPCHDCGQTFQPECMDFDHVRGEKLMGVGLLVAGRIERLETEIAKCDLVCANCHRIRTYNNRIKTNVSHERL